MASNECVYIEASPGVEAELLVQGPMNAAGYYNRPDLTAKAFDKEGYYHTVCWEYASKALCVVC